MFESTLTKLKAGLLSHPYDDARRLILIDYLIENDIEVPNKLQSFNWDIELDYWTLRQFKYGFNLDAYQGFSAKFLEPWYISWLQLRNILLDIKEN